MRRAVGSALVLFLFFATAPWPIEAQKLVYPRIVQTRGADPKVDYAAMARFAPWDDRNYELTAADLRVLAPNEEELIEPLPVFFRVLLRKNWPELRRQGPAQYPRSALQIFRQKFGGYLINGKLYTTLTYEDGLFLPVEVPPAGPQEPGLAAAEAVRSLSGEVRVSTPVGAAESAIKINPVNPDLVIAGSNGPGAGQKMHFSSDGGATWTETTLPLGGTCCDPTVEWSSDGTIGHAATLGNCGFSGCAVWYYRSSDNGQTWTDLQSSTPGDPRRELTNSGSDKEFLHLDRFPTSPHLDNLYLTWHDANVLQFGRSTDNGNTWSVISFGSDPVGIGSDITTDKNGNVYYIWAATSAQRILLKRSTDGGASFPAGTTQIATTNGAFDFPIPSIETRNAWIYASADADLSSGPFGGSIYAAWTDTTGPESGIPANNHTRIQVAFSRDGGATWTVVTPHETADQNTVDRWNQWLAVGPDGTVHVVFYDTRNDPTRSSVDLYYARSTDGAQTFEPPQRLTSVLSPNLADFFEFGDYNGLDVVMNDLIAIYTDSRDEGGGGDSQDIYAIGAGAGSAQPQIQVPGNVALGSACLGSPGSGTLHVCNTGKADLIVDPITASDPQFSATPPSAGFPVTISPDFCFPFQLVFTAGSTGPQSATLTIPSNDPDNPNTTITVTGSGTQKDIRVTGSTDFGVVSSWSPAERMVTVCNAGDCALTVSSAAINCSDFTLIGNPLPVSLGAGSCLDLTVAFTPATPGRKTCLLTVTSDDPDTPSVTRPLTARTPPYFSVHPGLADPHGVLNGVVRQGSSFTLDFLYPIRPRLAWDLRLGVLRFDGRGANPDIDLWNLGANAKFTINPAAPVRVFLMGGPDLYHFDPGDFEGGVNLGLGLGVPAGSRFVLEATYNYHWTLTASPDLELNQIELGLLISL